MKNLITYLKTPWSRVADSQRKKIGVTLGEATIEHPFSTYSAPFGTCWQPSGKLHSVVRCAAMLVMLFTIGVGQTWCAELTYTHDFTTTISSGDNTLSTITWTASSLSNVGSYNSTNYKGVQIGTSSKSGGITLTSKNNWGAQSSTSYYGYTNVKKVYVWMNAGANGTVSATVTIGGKSATSDGTTVVKNSSASSQRSGTTKVTYTPAADGKTGAIVITVTKATAKASAGYLCAIQVVCEEPGGGCDKTVTLSYDGDAASHGEFVLKAGSAAGSTISEGGTTDNCGSGTTVVALCPQNVDAHWHLEASNITATNKTGSITSDGNGNFLISYTQGSNVSSSVSVTFTEDTHYTVTWMSNGSQHTTTEVYSGEKPTFPSNPSSCDGTSTAFYGWATSTWTGKLDDVSAKTIYLSGDAMPAVSASGTIYHAVFAKESATAFEKITSADNVYVGQKLAIVSNKQDYILPSNFAATTAATHPNSNDSKLTVTSSQVWTITDIDEYGYYKFMNSTTQMGVNRTSGLTSGSAAVGNYSTVASWWAVNETTNFDYTVDDCFYMYNWATDTYYNFLENSGSSWLSYYATGITSGNKVWYAMKLYQPERSEYLTSCCTDLGAIDGTISLSQTETTMTVKNWSSVSNASSYTVKLYKWNGSSWTIVSGSTSGGGSGTQGTRTGVSDSERTGTGVTWSSIEYGATYKVTVTAIGNGSTYCDGPETAVTSVNSNALTDNKILWKYSIYMDDGTNSDSGWGHNWISSLTSNTGSVTINGLTASSTYKWKLTLGGVVWYSANATMTSADCTNWTLYSNVSQNCGMTTGLGGNYTFTVNTGSPQVSVTYPLPNQDAGNIVYWDASIHGGNWTKLIFRVGTSSNANAGSDCKVVGQLVPGTDQFYKVTTASFTGMDVWAIANNSGWTGSNTNGVYKTNTGDSYAITKSSAYQNYIVDATGVTLIPAAAGSTGEQSHDNNCTFYPVTKTDGMLTHTATISATSHGSINIAYTDVSGTAQDKTATTAGLAHRTILTVSSTPASGYSRSTLTVNGDAHTSGNTHILETDATIAATFSPNNYTITLNNHSATTAGTANIAVTFDATTNLTGTPAITVPTKTGYTFGGYYTGEDGAGSQIIAANGNVNASVASYTSSTKQWIYAGDITLHAKWTINSHTLTWNWGGGSCSGTAGTHYTAGGSLNYGTAISYPDGSYMSKAGYTFSGWSTDATTMPDENLTITAQWTAKEDTYKTALHTGESGWTTYASGVTKSGAGYSIPAPSSVDKGATSSCEDLHYVFAGWVADEYKASPDGHIISASGTTDATGTTYWAVWGDAVPTTTYTRLTSIAGVEESAQYVLGIDGTGFHYSGTSNWGLTDLPANHTPLYYTLTKEDAATPTYFTAATSISSDTYYLQVAGTGAFNMTTTSGTSAGQLVIGSTTNYGGADKAYAVSVKGGTDKSLRRNGGSGIRCYNNTTTGSLVFFYKVVKSGDIDYVTSCCELKPATSVTVTSTTGTSATLSWTAPSPTTGISKLQVRDASDNTVLVDNLDEDATGATVSGLTECDEYTFYVASVGATCYTASESVEAQPYSGAKTVTYKYHDDATPDGTFTTDCSHTSTTLPNPSRTGYTLNGWYTASEGGTKKGDGGASYTPDADITLHAQWSIINSNVTYSAPSNGNYTIQVADGSATSATKAANYNQTITIAATPSSGYRFGSWTITNTSTSADVTSSVSLSSSTSANATFTMPAYGVTVTATFIQTHTLNFVAPTGGGSAVTPPATADHGGTVTLPSTTGKLPEYSCETFLGWTTTAPDGSGTWASTPSYKAAGATSDVINSNTTFYAVYSRSGGGASGTVELTGANIGTWYTSHTELIENGNIAYGKSRSITVGDYTWTTNGYQQGAQTSDYYLSLRERTHANGVSWIQIPTMPGDINTITFSVTNGGSAATTNVLYLQSGTTSGETVIASSENTSSLTRTIEVTGSHTSGYITANGTIKVRSITVSYGPAPIISHALHCDCPITQFDLTYNANTGRFPGSTISCDDVDDYAWAAHDDIYTICATEPTCEGYKFIDWTTNANGSGDHYNAGQEISCVATADVTLYAQYERVYTVTFNNQGVTTPVTQASYGATIAVPSATSPCSAEWAFVGWSETAIAPMSFMPTLEITAGTSTYTPTADKTLYAIYRKTSTSDAFVAGMSGAYKISNGSTVYAGACNNSKLPETDAAGAAVFYIKYTAADGGKYTIQQADGKYLKYSGSSTGLALDNETPYYWTMAKNGTLWRVQSETAGRYLEHDAGTGFKAYNGGVSYTDLSFVAAEGQYYYRTMSCADEFDITFHDNGTTINWAEGHPEATYKDLADATVVSTFPTATFDGWTFLGWRTADYDESTTAPEASGIYSTGGNALTISSADVDLYPVFTRFEDNPPFDEINGGDYYIYFLDEGSDDGYGAARRVYASSYADHKRYNSTAICASATEFTFTKLENGNWTIYDKTTSKYLYAEGDDWLQQKAGTANAEWTLTVNGNAFDAYCVGTSYGQISAYGNGLSATFENYARSNIGVNPSYHRVYLGGCTNRTFTTNPSTTPYITMNGEVAPITSSQNGAVRATNVLSVSGGNFTPSTGEITISSNNSDVYFSLSADKNFAKGVSDHPKLSVTITANGSGIVTPTPIYVHYKPSSNADAWTEATITASYTGAEDAEVTAELRTVKENFVIAAKVGGNWYALPANMTTGSVYEPVLIDVDESAKIAYGPATVGYKMWPVQTVNGGTDEYATNGDKVRFAGNGDAGLWASNSNNNIRDWSTITAIGSTTTPPAAYEWLIETEDRNAYTLKSMHSTNYLDLYRPSSGTYAGKLVWASNNTYETNEIHFFPLEERATITIIPREWKANGLVFSVPADNQITAASYKIGTGSETSTTYTRHSTGGYGLYEVALPDLTSQYGKLLTLKLTISGTPTYATTTIPIIVNANASTKTNEPFATLGAATKDYDVVVLDGKTLTTDAVASGACKFQNLYIYPGATLVNSTNNNLSVRYLELRGGIKGIDHKSDLAQGVPHLKLDKNFSSTAGANLDMCVNTAHSYALSVPFDVTLSTVNFANSLNTETSEPINGTLDAQFMIMEYDGAQRSSTGKGWKHITSTERVLHAGEGYVLQGKRPKGQPFAVIRFPFSSVSGWADGSGEVVKSAVSIYGHAGGASTPDNDKGWNLIANPYMATLSYNGADEGWAANFTVGSLVKTDTDPWDGKYEWTSTTNAYVTMPNEWYTEFPQYRANSAQAVFEPFKNFFIQASADGSVTFDKSKRASAPRHLLAQVAKAQPIYADINLTHGEAFAQAGLTVDENATAGYKFGEDQNIFENRSDLTYLKVYTVADGHYLVGNTMTPAETEELIPVEFYAPNAGEYIFSLDDNSDIDRLEYVILYDAVLGLNTNLLTDDYVVELDETGLIENRFSIGLRIKEKEDSATGVDNVNSDNERPFKFIYQDKLYILQNGVIYDATGKRVK